MSEARTKDERLFPIQPQRGPYPASGKVREPVYMAAYEVYSHVYAPQEAMIDHARGCRGGFSIGEMIGFLYARSFPKTEWRARVTEAFKDMENL